MNTRISLDPQFLNGLGIITSVDACLPDRLPVADERHVVLHPSFLKDYSSGGGALAPLWRRAAQELRNADRVFIVGYSLPKADSAAFTLFLTNCDGSITRIVNPDGGTKMRLAKLLQTGDGLEGTAYFQDWARQGCPDRIPWIPKRKIAV
jgi:hypothetical protein